jgi:hypothetical protein
MVGEVSWEPKRRPEWTLIADNIDGKHYGIFPGIINALIIFF